MAAVVAAAPVAAAASAAPVNVAVMAAAVPALKKAAAQILQDAAAPPPAPADPAAAPVPAAAPAAGGAPAAPQGEAPVTASAAEAASAEASVMGEISSGMSAAASGAQMPAFEFPQYQAPPQAQCAAGKSPCLQPECGATHGCWEPSALDPTGWMCKCLPSPPPVMAPPKYNKTTPRSYRCACAVAGPCPSLPPGRGLDGEAVGPLGHLDEPGVSGGAVLVRRVFRCWCGGCSRARRKGWICSDSPCDSRACDEGFRILTSRFSFVF